jgi:NAD(P)-dependent dehydrogenase (short-subunit alcohol dehydrogenase family)
VAGRQDHQHGKPGWPPWRAAWWRLLRIKAAVISLTQSAGLNLIEHGINVNAISPGVVDGEHWDGVDAFFAKYEGKAPGQKKKPKSARRCPSGGWARPRTFDGMAVFLATAKPTTSLAKPTTSMADNG